MSTNLLDPGFTLTLRPMKYELFYERYLAAIKNTWTVEEVDFKEDINHLANMTPAEQHLVKRLVAFFATGDTIVSNNLVLNLYRHINSPEARMYLSRQLFEEAQHVQFYLTLLDKYIPDPEERAAAFKAVDTIPSIAMKAQFCQKWIGLTDGLTMSDGETKYCFLMTLIAFATAIEGLFFFGAFAYVYFLRSRGLLPGLAGGTNWVFRDESMHMGFALDVVKTVKQQEPELFDDMLYADIGKMLDEALECEMQFAEDALSLGVSGLSPKDMRTYLEFVVDQRRAQLDMPIKYGSKNPFDFMAAQDVQELANFFERRVSAYQKGITGAVSLNADF